MKAAPSQSLSTAPKTDLGFEGPFIADRRHQVSEGHTRPESDMLFSRAGAFAETRQGASEWACLSISERVGWVRRFRDRLVRNIEPLVELVADETHKPKAEAVTADLAPLLASCRWHERYAAGVLRPRRAPGTPLWLRAAHCRLTREPLGRVGIIATWNYPVQLLGVQLVQSLVAGNTVVVKPSERAPRTQSLVLDLAEDTGLPSGTLSRRDATPDEGRRMILEDHLDHLVFTGSTRTGREIARAAAERLLPTTLELSGNDSAIVLADADPVLAARSIWFAVTVNGGQTCMAPRRALVDRRIYERFLAELAPLVASAVPRRLIDVAAAERCNELCRAAIDAGGRSLSGFLEPPAGSVIRPAAIVDCPASAALVEGDHFGPVLAVVAVDDLEQALAIHGRHELDGEAQHLACSIYTRMKGPIERSLPTHIAQRLGSSFITINDSVIPQAHPATAIAGRGASGWGASRGEAGLLAMTRPVAVAWTGRLFRTPTDPPTPDQTRRLTSLIAWLYR